MKHPNDQQALVVGRLVLQLAEALGIGAASAPEVYTQSNLPRDAASEDAFVRTHRAQLRAGVEGWTKSGSVRAVTAEAWATYVAEQTAAARARPKRTAPSEKTRPANDVAAELGIKLRQVAR